MLSFDILNLYRGANEEITNFAGTLYGEMTAKLVQYW